MAKIDIGRFEGNGTKEQIYLQKLMQTIKTDIKE